MKGLFGVGLFGALILAGSAMALPAQASPVSRPRTAELEAVIDLRAQRMQVYINDALKYTWKVSTARPGYVTPKGSYRPIWLARMHYSRKYDNAPMPHAVFFHGGHAVHGTSSLKQLGRPASHGCVRLHPDNAQAFFSLVQKYGKANSKIIVVDHSRPAVAQRGNPPPRAASGRPSPRGRNGGMAGYYEVVASALARYMTPTP
ncbi:MAG: L,D-transpeptidase [Gammaproteobacteria bacterium]|nr:L,D-transpeptidase [Gammaproteobacteria bacterium]MBU1655035.1 L,D-transpeptidase [Gammaproteobacteria bacterium]MBU1961532.1 L,D-transpeptidase [Gammaproteobacteria bacterium]